MHVPKDHLNSLEPLLGLIPMQELDEARVELMCRTAVGKSADFNHDQRCLLYFPAVISCKWQKHIHIHNYTHIYIYTYVYTHVHTYTHIYIYTCKYSWFQALGS